MYNFSNFTDKDDWCAVCIGKENQSFHCGLLYKIQNGKSSRSFMIHLTLPNTVVNEDVLPLSNRRKYFWDKFIGIPNETLMLLATKCETIFNSNNQSGINYGLIYDKDSQFDIAGNLVLGKKADGLTCSTFVLAVLNSVGIKLIDETKWPILRDDNGAFIDYLIDVCEEGIIFTKAKIEKLNSTIKLSSNKNKVQHINDRKKYLSQVLELNKLRDKLDQKTDDFYQRFKPTEVAGIAYTDSENFPVKFHCENGKLGAWILGSMLSLNF